jgi:hypothetical protein
MTTIEYFLYRILIVGALAALLNGCSVIKSTPSPEQVDRSPFTGIPCAAPCWHSLLIGKSAENDVINVLPSLTFIDQKSVKVSKRDWLEKIDFSGSAPGMVVYANCIYPNGKLCLSLTVVDDVLTNIVIDLNYDITVDEAIKYLGNPDRVVYRNSGAEWIICYVDLIWGSKQLVLTSRRFEGYEEFERNCGVVRDTGKVPSSLLLSEVGYVSSSQIEDLLSPSTYNLLFSGTIP